MSRLARRLWLLLLPLAPLSGYAQAPAQRPRLVVVISIDQFRADYLQRFSRFFGPGGFNLLLQRGANFTEAHYQHSTTQTCPGHAVILTGSYGNVNGIISNTWYDSAAHKPEYCAADTAAKLVGIAKEGRSPINLLVSTVGDELKTASNGRSKVITMAGKDRSAIMLGGHQADAAYWTEDTLFVSSTYYMKQLPQWVQRFNASGHITRYRGAVWDRVLPPSEYSMMGPDDVPAEENAEGMGRTFPHRLGTGGSAGGSFVESFQVSPFENEALVEFAMEAVKQEGLGRDDDTDLLGIGFSANDLVGHSYGPDSHEMMDMTIRTDRLLQSFFTFLGQQVGMERVLIVITSDHGVVPFPELMQRRNPRLHARRLDPALIQAAAEQALRARYGVPRRPGYVDQPTWIMYEGWPWLYLNLEGLRDKRIRVRDAERVAQRAVRRVPGVDRAITATELARLRSSGSHTRAELSFYPGRSGNVYYELAPYVVAEPKPEGTTHGSPWEYDTHVPLLWFGAGIRPGMFRDAVSMADLAPTLSALLGIPEPSGSSGTILKEMMLTEATPQ
jgi:predicted AlkP superfamily pyrophosphatase or phosphodiesterase